VIRVVVADDQALVRGGFRLILDAHEGIEVVGEACDGREAIDQARTLRPHVVLMDIRMPVLDGLQATRQILAMPDPPHVLMLTTFDLDEYVYDALRTGAIGFLLKDVRPEQLADAVRVVAAGDTLLAPALTRRLVRSSSGPRRGGAWCRTGSHVGNQRTIRSWLQGRTLCIYGPSCPSDLPRP